MHVQLMLGVIQEIKRNLAMSTDRRRNKAMHEWSCGFVRLSIVLALVVASARGEGGASPLKPRDVLPPLVGQTLTGRQLALPSAAQGNVAVVIFSFTRAGGRDAKSWAQHLSKDDPSLLLYTAIFLESVPHIFRAIAVSEIRNGMPQARQDRTLLLYDHQSFWEQRLHVTDKSQACVLLVGRSGDIQWLQSGPFGGSLYFELKKQIRALN